MYCSSKYRSFIISPMKLELASEKSKIVSFFTEGDGSKQPPNSLYFQFFSRKYAICLMHL